jgi:hypothetical protein
VVPEFTPVSVGYCCSISVVPEFTPVSVGYCCSILGFIICSGLWTIFLSFRFLFSFGHCIFSLVCVSILRYSASSYPFGIFKHFIWIFIRSVFTKKIQCSEQHPLSVHIIQAKIICVGSVNSNNCSQLRRTKSWTFLH